MPLSRGRGKAVVSKNIGEMMKSYKATGKIGSTKPKSVGHAQKIAAAAAYSKAGISSKSSKSRPKKTQADVTSKIMGSLSR